MFGFTKELQESLELMREVRDLNREMRDLLQELVKPSRRPKKGPPSPPDDPDGLVRW